MNYADDIEVTGPLSAILYVSSSAKATDFAVKLVDVNPDVDPTFGLGKLIIKF